MAMKPAWHFWLIGTLGLIWHAMGCANYLMQLSADRVAQMPENYQAFINARPAWATAVFAITVFAGLIGCLLLLMRRRLSQSMLALSLFGASGAVVSVLGQGDTALNIGTGASLAVAFFLQWYATKMQKTELLH